MLDPHVDILGLDGEGIANAWTLALPPAIHRRSWALVIQGRGIAVTGDGARVALDESEVQTDRASLRQLRDALGVDAVAVVEPSILRSIYAAVASSVLRREDLPGQLLAVYTEARRRQGDIATEPPLLELLPPLHPAALAKSFQLLMPDDTTAVLYVFEKKSGPLFTSVIAHKERGVITAVAMHPAISDRVSAWTLRSWPTDYHRINEAVQRRFAKPSISVFTDLAAVMRLRAGDPETLAREVAARNLIIDPMPPWLAAIVGGSAAVAVAHKGADVALRFLPRRARALATASAQLAKSQLGKTGIASLESTLGFDPIKLWQTLAVWYRDEPSGTQR